MRKMNLIIAAIACVALCASVLTGFKSLAATNEAAQGKTLGGWEVAEQNNPVMINEKDNDRIETVLKGSGDNFKVLDLVATQVVSGTNYKALCRGSDGNLYVVTWYNDLQNNASFTSAECVNIGAYSGL